MGNKNEKTPNNLNRRKALKTVRDGALLTIAATQVPKEWIKPVVDSVILPAHAATTAAAGGGTTTTMPTASTTTPASTTSATTTMPTASTTAPASTTSAAGNAGNASDIRLKTNISPLAVILGGLQLYRFQYKNDTEKKDFVGLMAQDLVASHPHVLNKNPDGLFLVRYDLLGMKMTTLEEWEQKGIDSVMLAH